MGIPRDLWLTPSLCVRRACRARARLLPVAAPHCMGWGSVLRPKRSACGGRKDWFGSSLFSAGHNGNLAGATYAATPNCILASALLCLGAALCVGNDVGCSFLCLGFCFSYA